MTVTNGAGASSTFMGYLTGGVALVKSGAGALILNAPLNEYTNTTTVNGGILTVNPVGAGRYGQAGITAPATPLDLYLLLTMPSAVASNRGQAMTLTINGQGS